MHRPVMVDEVLAWLPAKGDGTYVDATLGGGGHAESILARLGPRGRLLGLDADPDAVARARTRLARFGERFLAVHARFSGLVAQAREHGLGEVDGVLLDLGISSDQLDDPRRGFGFQREGPLDMRMDPGQPTTARDLVNGLAEGELAALLRDGGEEPAARRIARRIVRERAARPIETTTRLAEVVSAAKGGRRGRIHPATQTFQALRIAVNAERAELAAGLDGALALLRPGGRMAVIAFHSLEDRAVKQFFRRHAGREEALQGGGTRWMGERPPVRVLTRRPVRASTEEVAENPRARSAKLRVAERTE